jgi:hypothetical protein
MQWPRELPIELPCGGRSRKLKAGGPRQPASRDGDDPACHFTHRFVGGVLGEQAVCDVALRFPPSRRRPRSRWLTPIKSDSALIVNPSRRSEKYQTIETGRPTGESSIPANSEIAPLITTRDRFNSVHHRMDTGPTYFRWVVRGMVFTRPEMGPYPPWLPSHCISHLQQWRLALVYLMHGGLVVHERAEPLSDAPSSTLPRP